MEAAANNSSAAGEFNPIVWQCMRHKVLCDVNGRPRPVGMFTHHIVNIVLNALLALTAILGNSLIFAAYYQSHSLRKPVNTILLSLAATDFLCGATSQPFYIYEKVLMMGGCTTTVCTVVKLEKVFMLFLIGATILNLSATTLDRYIAVCHSFKYLELVTNSRVKKLLGGMWAVWLIISLVGVQFEKIEILFIIVLSSNIIFISVLYSIISIEIRRIKANEVPAMQYNQEQQRDKEERKGAKTVGIILGLLALSFVPLLLYGIFSVARLPFYRGHLLAYASTAAFANSSFNVFVYYWRNEQMRKAMMKVVRKITQRCRNQVNP